MKQFFRQIMQDKDGRYSLRELAILLLLLAMITAWTAQQFFGAPVPEFIYYSFTSLIASGCFGYSFERKTIINNNEKNINEHE
jgi:hypothetical protein